MCEWSCVIKAMTTSRSLDARFKTRRGRQKSFCWGPGPATGDAGKFGPYALVAKRIPARSAALCMLSKASQAFLALTQSFDSDDWAYWATLLYSEEQNEASVQNQWARADQISPSFVAFLLFRDSRNICVPQWQREQMWQITCYNF